MKIFTRNPWIIIMAVVVIFASCDGSDPDPEPEASAPTGTDVAVTASAIAGEDIIVTGTFSDEIGLASIVLENTEFALAKTIELSDNPTTYSLEYTVATPAETVAGSYTINVTVNNTSGKSASFTATVTIEEPVAYENMYAAGGFQWWTWNAEHAYMMLPDPNDDQWFEMISHAWGGEDWNQIKFLSQLAWEPNNWGLVDNSNPALGMINSEDSQGIIMDDMGDNPAYYKVRFNPYELEYTLEKLTVDIEVQDSMFIVGSGFTDYPNLDWNTQEAIPMSQNFWEFGEHIYGIEGLTFSEAVSLKFIGQRDGWSPIDVGFDEDYIVDVDANEGGFQVNGPISWIPTASGDGTADLKFVDQAGAYTVLYDNFAKRALIWKE